MTNLAQIQLVNPLEYLSGRNQSQTEINTPAKVLPLFDLKPAPPHAMLEDEGSYSVIFNMLGIDQKGIGIDVNFGKREVTVLARRESKNFRHGFYWVFGVPSDALLGEMTSQFKNGVLEIVIPKVSVATLNLARNKAKSFA